MTDLERPGGAPADQPIAPVSSPSDQPDPADAFDWLENLEPEPTPAPIPPSWLRGSGAWAGHRPAWGTVVALFFALNALSLILYAGLLPLLPPVLSDPAPMIGIAFGLASAAAAVGIFSGREVGRWLGIGLVIAWLARDAVLLQAWLQAPDDPRGLNLALDILLPVVINATILVLLLRGWPRQPAEG
jgi:hypothetical protein